MIGGKLACRRGSKRWIRAVGVGSGGKRYKVQRGNKGGVSMRWTDRQMRRCGGRAGTRRRAQLLTRTLPRRVRLRIRLQRFMALAGAVNVWRYGS